MFYTVSDGPPLPRNPFKALVAPRPIGWIATRDREGRENLAPYSYFNAVCDEPPIVMFSSIGEKDSLTNAREKGCFVAHSVSRRLMEAMNQSSAAYARGVSEISQTGLATRNATLVDAPILVDAPSAFECYVTDIIQPKGRNGAFSNGYMVFGEVVGVHIQDELITPDGRVDTAAAALVARCGYFDYAIVDEMVELPRPQRPS